LSYFESFRDLAGSTLASKVIYPPDEIVVLSVLAGAEAFVDIAQFGESGAAGA
jgi:hypothetical protein